MVMAGIGRRLFGKAIVGGRRKLQLFESSKFSTSLESSPFNELPMVMTPDMIESRIRLSLKDKILDQMEIVYPNKLDNRNTIGFLESYYRNDDLDVLRSLLKDYKNLNRKKANTDAIIQGTKEFLGVILRRKKESCYFDWGQLGEGDTIYSKGSILEMKEDEKTIDMARRIVQMYNHHHNLNLEFARVIQVVPDPFPLHRHIVLEARNAAAARAPTVLNATYSFYNEEVLDLHAPQPVPFMKVNHNHNCTSTDCVTKADCEALLFANIKNCPIIGKRLGLNEGLIKRTSWVRGEVVKVPKDNPCLASLAKFAVQEQNQFGDQRVCLRFVRVAGGTWAELISKDTTLYHIMLVASEVGVEKVFYAAVFRNSSDQVYKCIDWAAASRRATMPLPC